MEDTRLSEEPCTEGIVSIQEISYWVCILHRGRGGGGGGQDGEEGKRREGKKKEDRGGRIEERIKRSMRGSKVRERKREKCHHRKCSLYQQNPHFQ